jgi:hypothetical protein
MSYIGSKQFDEAVTALLRLNSLELCIEALHQSMLRERGMIIEQNEANARAAGYPNLISMQHEEADRVIAHCGHVDPLDSQSPSRAFVRLGSSTLFAPRDDEGNPF